MVRKTIESWKTIEVSWNQEKWLLTLVLSLTSWLLLGKSINFAFTSMKYLTQIKDKRGLP